MNKLTADVDQNLTQFPSEGVKIRDLHHRSSLTRNVLQLFFVDPSANTNRNDVDTFVLNEKKRFLGFETYNSTSSHTKEQDVDKCD